MKDTAKNFKNLDIEFKYWLSERGISVEKLSDPINQEPKKQNELKKEIDKIDKKLDELESATKKLGDDLHNYFITLRECVLTVMYE